MPVNTVKQSKQATKKQLAVLKQLYRFRFGTSDLLARSLDLKDGRYIHMRLDASVKQEYIGKNYNSSYKLEGKPATYYLLPKAFAALKQHAETDGKEVSLNAQKRLQRQRCLRTVRCQETSRIIYDKLRASYNKSLGFWTKEQLNFDKYSHFPQPLPDAFHDDDAGRTKTEG